MLVAPEVRAPRLQVTVVTLLAVAFEHAAAGLTPTDLNCALSGSFAIAATPVAVAGPLFVTLIVYVTIAPFFALAGPVAATARSAVGGGDVTVMSFTASVRLCAPCVSVAVSDAW